ncbi:STAS-like domain-containing protein [Methanobrevibacter sp.]
MNAIEIDLEKTFAKKLGLRTTAMKLFNDLENEEEAIFDFKNIEFISRSFAQEYVYQKHNSKIHITESNMSDFIKNLLEVVEEDYKESCLINV